MRTNIEIDDELMAEVMKLGEYKTKREAVHEALKVLLRIKKQRAILELKGKLRWEGDLDAMRRD